MPTLVVAGEADQSPLTTRGPDWFTDGYHESPGPKSLPRVAGAEHGLGGVPAYGGMPEAPQRTPLRSLPCSRSPPPT